MPDDGKRFSIAASAQSESRYTLAELEDMADEMTQVADEEAASHGHIESPNFRATVMKAWNGRKPKGMR